MMLEKMTKYANDLHERVGAIHGEPAVEPVELAAEGVEPAIVETVVVNTVEAIVDDVAVRRSKRRKRK